MGDIGDTPIRLDEYQFTLAEAAQVSGVAEKTVRNWIGRDVLKVGQKHFTGRLIFNFLDLVRLSVMNDLTTTVPLLPADAVVIAEMVAERAVERAIRNPETGELVEFEKG